jgi:hypothetical protein
VPTTAVLAGDRLDRIDLVRPRVLPKAEEDHPSSAVCHDGIIPLGDGFPQGRDDTFLIFGLELREERECKCSVTGVLGYRAHAFREPVALTHVRLEVHRGNVMTRLDPLRA